MFNLMNGTAKLDAKIGKSKISIDYLSSFNTLIGSVNYRANVLNIILRFFTSSAVTN